MASATDYCVLVTDIPNGCESQDIENHFLKKCNGGCGDVAHVVWEYDGNPHSALVLFESANTVRKVLNPKQAHEFGNPPKNPPKKLKVQKLDEPFQELTATLDLNKVPKWNQEAEKYLGDHLRLRLSKRCDSVNLTGCYWQLEAARSYLMNGGVQDRRTASARMRRGEDTRDKPSSSPQSKKREEGIAAIFPNSDSSLEAAVDGGSEQNRGAFGGARPKTTLRGEAFRSSAQGSALVSQSSGDLVRAGVPSDQSLRLEIDEQKDHVQETTSFVNYSREPGRPGSRNMTRSVVISGSRSATTGTGSPTNGLRGRVGDSVQQHLARKVKPELQSMLRTKPAGAKKPPEDHEERSPIIRPRTKSLGKIRPKTKPGDKPGLKSLRLTEPVVDVKTADDSRERTFRSTRPRSSSLSRRGRPLSIQPVVPVQAEGNAVVESDFSGSNGSSFQRSFSKEEESPSRGTYHYADDHQLASLQVSYGPHKVTQKQARSAQELRVGKKLLKAYSGDISKAEVNVIVVPVGLYCQPDTDIAAAFYRAAGNDYRDQVDSKVSELKYKRLFGRDEIFTTLPYGLKCDQIWHIRNPNGTDSKRQLKLAIGALLQDIDKDKYMKSIAIPVIGAGSEDMDPYAAARVIVQTVADFQERHLEEIHLVDSDATKVTALKWALTEKERQLGPR